MNMQAIPSLDNVKAIVTGGASGLGLATTEAIIAAGGSVTMLDINRSLGESVQQKLGSRAFFTATDVSAEPAVDAAVAKAVAQMGMINLAVNCAGIAPSARVLAKDGLMPTADFAKVIAINLTSSFSVVRAVANVMQHNELRGDPADQQRGVIINTASIAAFDGLVGQAAYAASKGGIASMTLPLAREFSRFAIRVMTIAPGLFRTPMFATLPAKAVAAMEQATPFPKRLGNPGEFAAMVCHIFQNTMLNGEIIRLDGGLRMS